MWQFGFEARSLCKPPESNVSGFRGIRPRRFVRCRDNCVLGPWHAHAKITFPATSNVFVHAWGRKLRPKRNCCAFGAKPVLQHWPSCPFGGFGSELLQESDISLLSPCSPRNPPFPLRCGCPLVGAHVSVKQKLLCRRCEACAATLAILSIKNFGGFGDDECICLLNPALWVAWGHF